MPEFPRLKLFKRIKINEKTGCFLKLYGKLANNSPALTFNADASLQIASRDALCPASFQDADIVPMQVRHFGEFLLGNTPLEAQFTQSLSEDNPRARFSHDCDGKALPSYLSTHDTVPHYNV
jgi:hypothetical protein